MVVMVCTTSLIADNAAQYVAMVFIISVISLTAYVAFRLLKVSLNLISTLTKAKKKDTPVTNQRIANATKAKAIRKGMSGEAIADIPAYARKELGIAYPMTIEELNKSNLVVQIER
jgi:hypothetical protein